MSLGAATGAQDGFFFALGIGIATVQAFTDVGITALPLPLDDIGWDGWLFHQMGTLRTGEKIGSSLDTGPTDVLQWEIDSKAMRKVSVNEVVYAVLQSVESGTATANVQMMTRALFKLP